MPAASQATLNTPLLNHIGQVPLLSKQYLTDIVMLSLISSYTYSQRIEKKAATTVQLMGTSVRSPVTDTAYSLNPSPQLTGKVKVCVEDGEDSPLQIKINLSFASFTS